MAKRRLHLQCKVKRRSRSFSSSIIDLTIPPPPVLPSPCGYISSCVIECTVTYICDSLHIHHRFAMPSAKKQNTLLCVWCQVLLPKNKTNKNLDFEKILLRRHKKTTIKQLFQWTSFGLNSSQKKNREVKCTKMSKGIANLIKEKCRPKPKIGCE